MRRVWKPLLLAAILVALIFALLPLGRLHRLLRLAPVRWSSVRSVEAQGGWYDLLKYTDGCEWALLRVEDFIPPANWSAEPCTIESLPETFHADFAQALPQNAVWSTWHYVPVDTSLPFEEQEWFAALYDASGMLALYRGYALYGLD